jgi:hypothetical protein
MEEQKQEIKCLQSSHIAKKSDIVWHKIKSGRLFDAYYDTETTGLDKRFSEITQFGGIIRDIAGNVLYTADYRGKVSPYTVISPFAWLVQRMQEDEHKSGDPQYILAGRIMKFFRFSSNLNEAPFAEDFLKLCEKVTYETGEGNEEIYYSYPLMNGDGSIDHDCIRIHENLRKYYYRDPESGDWIKRNTGAGVYGYNNVKADDQWLWTLLHMSGAENIFITHLAQEGKHRLDILRAVETVCVAGPKGENGIRPGKIIDRSTGKERPSYSQGDIAQANTRIESALRGVLEGVTLPDGSYPDIDQLHGAFRDSFLLAGLHDFLTERVPDIMLQMERNTDWKAVVDNLNENPNGFGNRPVLSYVEKSFPFISGMMVSLIGADQYRHNPKTALVYNLGVDPETFYFNGKKLKDLTPDEHASLIKSSRDDPNGIYKVIRTHHSPGILSSDTGFAAGFNNGLDYPTLHKRAKFLRDHDLTENIMAGLRKAYPRLHGPDRLDLPQPEEELFTFSTLEMYDPEAGEDVQVHLINTSLEWAAHNSRKNAMLVRSLWRKAISPDEDILLNDFTGDQAGEAEAVKKFLNKIKSINKKLSENHGVALPLPDHEVECKKSALAYKIKILFYARNYYAKGILKDIGHNYWFEDKHGHKIPYEALQAWKPWQIDQAQENGDLIIRHERLNITAPIIDRILESLGFANILGEEIGNQLEALKALRGHGIYGHKGDDRWYTIAQAKRDLKRILNNELTESDVKALDKRRPGAWSIFVTGHHDSQSSLGAYMKYLNEKEKEVPRFTSARQVKAGLNPATGAPLEAIDYEIEQKDIIELEVPDRYLEKPPYDPLTNKPLWLVPLGEEFNRASLAEELKQGREIVLKGSSCGRQFHLAKAKITDVPQRGGTWEDLYEKANSRFRESGRELPKNEQLAALAGEGPYELHNLGNIDLGQQTVMVPKKHFEAMLDHKIASYPGKVTGIIVRDDSLVVKEGEIRILEQNQEDGNPTGWEFGSTVTGARRVSLDDIAQMTDDDAVRYGYPTADEMYGAVSTMFAEKKLDLKSRKNTVLMIDVDPEGANEKPFRTVFYNPGQRKISSIKIDYIDLAKKIEQGGKISPGF